ncbi:1-deoxy-D-xylulose-5-phosphate reductoisomerase [Aurantivibrio plasticivorans]
MAVQTVTILGSTGSIGESTLDVIAQHPDRYAVFALVANTSVDKMLAQCLACQPQLAVMRDEVSASLLRTRLAEEGSGIEVLSGEAGMNTAVTDPAVDMVMAAIVGAAGLAPTLAAVTAGKRMLLANKESLVMAGALFMEAVTRSGTILLPIDSEHNAIFQCLPIDYQDFETAGLKRILLTGSGGPFLHTDLVELRSITPEQACKHPNFSMGRKISVDSATMMNKGLEFIEACWLFDAAPEKIEVVVHPQQVIHSMVEYLDGSVLAQLGNPDMRTPIAHGLAWPERIESGVSPLDFVQQGRLDFFAPDLKRFPCLKLAMDAVSAGKTAQVVLNAANEIAVDAFLSGQLGFLQIAELIDSTLQKSALIEPSSIDAVIGADQEARRLASEMLPNFIQR